MIDQILIAKRLFSVGAGYCDQPDPLAAGLAISLFQDAVEQVVWCITKHHSITVKDNEAFTSLLDKVEKLNDGKLLHKAKMLELNKARTNFKHYGNLPASTESTKFRNYAESFMTHACSKYLDVDFDQVSAVALIADQTVRAHAANAESALANGDINDSVNEVALARHFLFKKLNRYLPKVDSNIRRADALLEKNANIRGVRIFSYLEAYLNQMARFNIAALAGGDISEHIYFENTLPSVTEFDAGNTKINPNRQFAATAELAERGIKYVTNTAVRLSELT